MIIARVAVLDIEKIAVKHGVRRHEIHELFRNGPHIRFIERGHYRGEDVHAALGQTDGGRFVIAFFVYKQDRTALVLSVRDMEGKERRLYARR